MSKLKRKRGQTLKKQKKSLSETNGGSSSRSTKRGDKCQRLKKQKKSLLETNRVSKSRSTERVEKDSWNFGKPSYKCIHCGSVMWYEERTVKNQEPAIPFVFIMLYGWQSSVTIIEKVARTIKKFTRCGHW
ncbi:uncharacterized protein LOC116107385 [Pistacia vera]|uniref:uncharacterized protein LOC116107385 n=1 Tax=Pistacia vera TaxID=55513 RepID=UPI001263D530|nr:uncharacterized protein LOC116107385 [Pistacia vera]